MISKVLQADSFYHTARYIVQKSGMEVIFVEGVRQHDVALMAADFETQAALRPQKAHACFHSILSFYPGEKLSDEKMLEMAERYLKELNITNTQVAITKHTDKAHLHLHIMANMVNNDGKSISSGWIGLRGKKIAQKLTLEYQLTPALEKNLALTNLEALNEMQATKYKIYIAVSENLPHSKSMDDLEDRLQKSGISIQYKFKSQTDEKQGISFKMGEYSFKGSKIGRRFSLGGLQHSLALQQKQTHLLTKEEKTPAQKMALAAWRENKNNRSIKNTEGISIGDGIETFTTGLSKIAEALMKPEQNFEQTPQELTAELKKLKRKRRQGHRL